MGYALDLRAARPLDLIVDELTRPTLAAADLDADATARLDQRVVDNWPLLAATVADAVADGGGTPEGSLIDYVVAVIGQHSHSWLPIDYSSASGTWFREELMGTHVADLIGNDVVNSLLSRPLAGLRPPELPGWGHLTADEVTTIADNGLAIPDDQPEQTTVRQVADVIQRAARLGCAIVTLHT